MKIRALLVFFVVVVCMLVYFGFLSSKQNELSRPFGESGKLSVVTTLYPYYDFAKVIGGENVEVSLLLPPGVEAHSFEPKPSDMMRINQSDFFLYSGKSMEPWAEEVIANANESLKIIDASQGIEMISMNGHDDHHEKMTSDPHIWLDFENSSTIVTNIANAFAEKDAANAQTYLLNAESYKSKLADIDALYRASLSRCKTNQIVYGGHYAFGYLVNRYGLKYLAAQGLAPDSEPTAKDMANLIEQVRQNHLKYIFFEELSSPKIAQTLADETGATMLLLNAAHNISKDEYEKQITFLEIMERNRKNLVLGLECKE